MKSTLGIILIIIQIFVVNKVNAYQGKDNSVADEKKCRGYGRTVFIETDMDNNPTETATAIGGEIGCHFSLTESMKVRVGFSSSIDPGFNNDNDINVHGDIFDGDKDSYIMLGEAVIDFNFGNLNVNLGRQVFDSPHMDSDDLRMIPNRFEAYQFNYTINEKLDAGFAYVRKMSGWENGNDQSHFIDVGRGLGADNGEAFIFWTSYEKEGLSLQLWDYVIEDIENIFYAEAVYSSDLNDDISYELGLQYDQGREIGSEKLMDIDADTLGLSAALGYKSITLFAAYNKNYGNSGALSSLGGGPFFTSMEDQTLDAVTGSDASSITLGIEVNPFQSLYFGFIAGDFRASNKSTYHVRENDFFISYQWKDNVLLSAVYSDITNLNSTDDSDQLRATLTYQFEGPF